jgi:hypothetical protein
MNKKRGQAAMEFLMTYGWAILAAIIVIGVLAIYFRPGNLVTENAIVTAPLYAVAAQVDTNQIQLEIRNNGGEDITTTVAALTGVTCTPGGGAATGTGIGTLAPGGPYLLTWDCSTGGPAAGETVSADVTITYTRAGSTLTQTSTGTISGQA